jgi:hypothetical protein
MTAQTAATPPIGETRTGELCEKGRLVTAPIAAGLAVWAGLVFLLAQAGIFQIDIGGIPVAIVAAVAVPVLGFVLAWRTIPAVRAYVEAQDLTLLTAVQGWRVVGAVFVFLWAYGQLPAVFALPAGLGDVAVGLVAPFAAIAVALKTPGWRRAANCVIIAGLADFAVAFATGIGSIEGNSLSFAGAPSDAIINALPLVMIPGFLVPVFIIAHVIAIIKLRSMR